MAVDRLLAERRTLVTSVEVFQELLHRYVAIDRRDRIQPTFDALRRIVNAVIGVVEEDVFAAKDVALGRRGLSARDALHTAVMQRHGPWSYPTSPWLTRPAQLPLERAPFGRLRELDIRRREQFVQVLAADFDRRRSELAQQRIGRLPREWADLQLRQRLPG